MIRYKSGGIITCFASSTECDDIVTHPLVSSKGYGKKKVCVKYHNSTTSYGLNNYEFCSEYSPTIDFNGSKLYFGSRSINPEINSISEVISYIADFDVDITSETETFTSSFVLAGSLLSAGGSIYFTDIQTFNNFIFSCINVSSRLTTIMPNDGIGGIRYENNIGSIVNNNSEKYIDPEYTFSKMEYNESNYSKITNPIYAYSYNEIGQTGATTIYFNSKIPYESFHTTNEFKEISNFGWINNFSSSSSSTYSRAGLRTYTYTYNTSYFYTITGTRNKIIDVSINSLNSSHLSFLPDDLLPIATNKSVITNTIIKEIVNTHYNFDYSVESSFYENINATSTFSYKYYTTGNYNSQVVAYAENYSTNDSYSNNRFTNRYYKLNNFMYQSNLTITSLPIVSISNNTCYVNGLYSYTTSIPRDSFTKNVSEKSILLDAYKSIDVGPKGLNISLDYGIFEITPRYFVNQYVSTTGEDFNYAINNNIVGIVNESDKIKTDITSTYYFKNVSTISANRSTSAGSTKYNTITNGGSTYKVTNYTLNISSYSSIKTISEIYRVTRSLNSINSVISTFNDTISDIDYYLYNNYRLEIVSNISSNNINV